MALQAGDLLLIERAGTPYKLPASDLKASPVALGYATGAGGVVTQGTSRTTGVTLNKLSGAITLFSKTTTASLVDSFTVTNSTVAVGDVIVLSVRGTGIYICTVTGVAAGSFRISVFTPAAISTAEAPIINYAVIKAVAA